MAPPPVSEASTTTINCLEGSGRIRTGASENLFKVGEGLSDLSLPMSGGVGGLPQNSGLVLDESIIENGKPQKSLQLFAVFRCGPLTDSLELCRIHLYATGRNYEPKKRDFVALGAFCSFWSQVLQSCQGRQCHL